MRGVIFGLLGMTCLVVCAFAARSEARGGREAYRPTVEWNGQFSAIREVSYVRVMDPPSWMKLWREHVGETASVTTSDALRPAIHFDQVMVVGIFTGEQSGKGGVVAVSIEEEDGLIRLRFEHMLAARRDLQAVTPYGIFVLPRSSKPIVLEENVSEFGEKAVWKERRKLPGIRD